jgi:hypothetical protein
LRHIQHRHAIDVDPCRCEIVSQQPIHRPRGLQPCNRIAAIQAGIGAARRIGAPVGRFHALHAAAFLIDQHRRIAAADDFAEPGGERA